MENGENITCTVKKKIIEFWVAVTPDGKELRIEGIDEGKLKEGMELNGEFNSNDVQDRYEDGSYSRSYHTEEWLQVN